MIHQIDQMGRERMRGHWLLPIIFLRDYEGHSDGKDIPIKKISEGSLFLTTIGGFSHTEQKTTLRNLVAFMATDDLKYLLFATTRAPENLPISLKTRRWLWSSTIDPTRNPISTRLWQ